LNLGGIGIYTTTLAKALKKRGEDVIVASSGGELLRGLEKAGIEHVYLPIDTSADIGLHTLKVYLQLSRLIRERGIQIVHAQTRVTQVIAALLCRKTGSFFVSTCHGFFKRRLFRRLFPCWGQRVIAISDAVREHLVNDLKFPKERVRIIYNGIDIDKFDKVYSEHEKSLIRREYGLRDVTTIGIISRLSDVKGHRYLLGALAKLLPRFSDIQLLIVGDGPAHYREGLKELARTLGIEDSVIFHEACKDVSMPLSVMDLFCMPSIQEGLGLSILEAMATGIPVVASDVGGIYTLIKHKKNGLLVPSKDEYALADAILKVLNNKAMAEEMVRLSKEIAREKFALGIMVDKVLKLYAEGVNETKV